MMFTLHCDSKELLDTHVVIEVFCNKRLPRTDNVTESVRKEKLRNGKFNEGQNQKNEYKKTAENIQSKVVKIAEKLLKVQFLLQVVRNGSELTITI